MKKTFALLATTTALGLAFGLPASSAVPDTTTGAAPQSAAPVVVSEKDDGWSRLWFGHHREDGDRGHHGKHHDDDDDDDHDRDHDHGRRGEQANPVPSGTMTPPRNGLFGNGAPPQVKVN